MARQGDNPQFCGCDVHTCTLVLAVVLLLATIIDGMLVVASEHYWLLIAVGLNLIPPIILILGNLLKKSVLYIAFFVFVAFVFFFDLGSLTYVFVKQSIDNKPWNSSVLLHGTILDQKQVIYDFTLAMVGFVELVFLAITFIVAWINFKLICQLKPRKAAAYNARLDDPRLPSRVVEMEVSEQHHTTDYY